jgi:hypothetical protein
MSLPRLALELLFIGCAGVAGLGVGGVLGSLNFSGAPRHGSDGLIETLLGAVLGLGIGLLLSTLLAFQLGPAQLARSIGVLLILLLLEFAWIYARMGTEQ